MYQNPKKSIKEKVRNSLTTDKSFDNDSGQKDSKRSSKISLQSQIQPLFFQKDVENKIKIKKWSELKSYEIRAMNRALSFGIKESNQSKGKHFEKAEGLCGNCGLRTKQDLADLKSGPNS